MGLASRSETEVNDIRHPLTPKSMNILKMRPPVLQEARRPVQPATPTTTSCQPIQDISQEEFKRFDCGWRGCGAVLTNATILYVHVQTHHCVQACKVVTASSTRKRARFSCEYDSCRNQGYISSEDLMDHIVAIHFKGLKLKHSADGNNHNGLSQVDAYMRPTKRHQLAPLQRPQFAKGDESYPEFPETAPSWKLSTPIVQPSRAKHLTWNGMLTRMPPRNPIPITWSSWTDTPDKPETELTFRDLPSPRLFDPNKVLDLSFSYPRPNANAKTRAQMTGTAIPAASTSTPEPLPFTGIGFRKPLVKETMTVLNGDRAQGFRSKPDNPNDNLPPTIGFEHSITLKEYLSQAERQQSIKEARAGRAERRKQKRN